MQKPFLAKISILALLALGCGWEPNTKLAPPTVTLSTSPGTRSVSDFPPTVSSASDFYRARQRDWENRQLDRRAARTSLHEEELEWISTPQDARVALLVSPETGFAPWGLETAVAEISPGWHTGKHRHGEVAIYVVTGEGFVSVDGVRYDVHPGTTVGVPYGARHQLFNLGSEVLRYFTATAYPLERHLGLNLLEQIEEHGPTTIVPELPVSEDGLDEEGRRIRLLWEEARYRDGTVGPRAWLEARVRGGVDLSQKYDSTSPGARNDNARLVSGIGHHSAWVRLMGPPGKMGFPNRMVVISGLLIEDPGGYSGRHAHMEAVIYVLSGEGYSAVDGEKVPWRPGTSVHIQGPQTDHQHFNTGDEPAVMLRVANGLRPDIRKTVEDLYPFLWFEAHGHGGEELSR